jgi:hypothetical protein
MVSRCMLANSWGYARDTLRTLTAFLNPNATTISAMILENKSKGRLLRLGTDDVSPSF